MLSCFSPTIHFSTPELCEQLNELQKGYEEAIQAAMGHTQREAADAHREYLAKCEHTAIETGEIEQATGRTLEDFYREFKHQFNVSIQASKSFAPKARELVRPHIQHYVEMVRATADKYALEEMRLYAALGLPWKVSPFVATLYRAAEIIEQHDGAGHDPKSVATFIDLKFKEHFTVIEHLKFEPMKVSKKK